MDLKPEGSPVPAESHRDGPHQVRRRQIELRRCRRLKVIIWTVSCFLFASINVLLVFFGLEFHEHFMGPVNLGLQVKASLLAHIVGLKVSFELLCRFVFGGIGPCCREECGKNTNGERTRNKIRKFEEI